MLHSFRVTSTGFLLVAALSVAAPSFAQGPARCRPPSAAKDAPRIRRRRSARRSSCCASSSRRCSRRSRRSRPRAVSVRRQRPRPPRTRRTPPAGVEVPAGAAGAGGPTGALPVYGNTSALSKIFNPDMAVIGNFVGAAGKNAVNPMPALRLNEAEASFQAIVDPYARADFFLSASPEGLEVEEGFITFTSLPGNLLVKVGKMKAQFGKVNTMHSHILPWVDEPLAMANLLGGEEGLNDSGISVSKLILNPVMFLEATGRGLQRRQQPVQELQAERSDLRRPPARVSRRHGRDQPGPRHVHRLRAQRRGSGLQDAALRRRRDGPLPPAAPGHLQALPRADGALLERSRAAARQCVGVRCLRQRGVSVRAPLVRRHAPGLLRARGRPDAERQERVAPADLLAERVQPGPRPVPPHAYAERVVANEMLFQFLFSIGAHGAHVF